MGRREHRVDAKRAQCSRESRVDLAVGLPKRTEQCNGRDDRVCDFVLVPHSLPTGGQAVWHEHEVTYAVVAPIALFGSLRKAYCEIHTRLARALRSLGVDAVLAPAHPPIRPSARPASCFASSVGGEILHRGRKLVGSAQVRRGDAFLQHGSILLDGSQPSSQNGATTLAAALRRPATFEEVVEAIIKTWSDLRPSGIASLAPR